MSHDPDIGAIAREVKTIAIVGLSPNPDRPSWGVARYLQSQGFRVIPVNPGHAGGTILGEPVYASLPEIPEDLCVDMVDIFRRSDAVAGIVEDALASLPELKVIWTQLGVRDEEAADRARARGLKVVQDRCPKVEFPHYL